MSEPLTEELLDKYVNRPLAKPVAWALLPTPISANQVTLIAALCGVAGGVAFARSGPLLGAAGFFLAWAALVLDCADGQLARARGGGSPMGYLLDGVSDYIIAFALHMGMMIAAWSTPGANESWRFWAVVSIILSGVVMAIHSNAFEAVKFRYRATLGEAPGQHVKKQEEILAILALEKGILAKIGRVGLAAYHRGQMKLNEAAREAGPIEARTFLFSTLLGPTLRLTVLSVAACASTWHTEALWLYPVFALLVGNLAYLALRLSNSE